MGLLSCCGEKESISIKTSHSHWTPKQKRAMAASVGISVLVAALLVAGGVVAILKTGGFEHFFDAAGKALHTTHSVLAVAGIGAGGVITVIGIVILLGRRKGKEEEYSKYFESDSDGDQNEIKSTTPSNFEKSWGTNFSPNLSFKKKSCLWW